MSEVKHLYASAVTEPRKLAGAIVQYMNRGYTVTVGAIGAGAVNQAIKGFTVARGMAATAGNDLYYTSGFRKEDVNGETKTVIVFKMGYK